MIERDMDDRKADKKHRKLTRTPEVSICDISSPHPLLSSSPTSSSSAGVALTATNPIITTSPSSSTSSLSFSTLLSHSTSLFNSSSSHNHHHQQQQQQHSTGGSQQHLLTGKSGPGDSCGHSASEECLKSSSSFIGKNFDYFRLSNHLQSHHDGDRNADNLATPATTTVTGERAESPNKSSKQQHLQIKSEEPSSSSFSASTSAFSLKRFSSFSFNRGSSSKRNANKENNKSGTISNTKSNNNIHSELSKKDECKSQQKETTSIPPATSTTSVASTTTTTVAASSPNARRALKTSTNPFHQQSSSTSTSSSISYQFSTDNTLDTIPACCLKVAAASQSVKHSPSTTDVPTFQKVRLSPTNLLDENNDSSAEADDKPQTSGINIQIKRNYHYQDPQFDQIFYAQEPIQHLSTNPFLSESIKRDEFLKATMRICLVVSPPSTKLQLKSRSLTHLDTLDANKQKYKVDLNENVYKKCCWPSSTNLAVDPASVIGGGQTMDPAPSQPPHPIANPATFSLSNYSFISPSSNSNCLTINSNRRSFRKPPLARSEASSSEYFTVCFDSDEREEILSAKRGVSLSYALNDALLKRNLSFSQITVQDSSYDLGTLSSVIDENTDVGNLIGKTLIVSEREFSTRNSKLNHYQLQKAASVGSRTKKLFSSASTEETLEASSSLLSVADSKLVTGKQQSKRWPGFLSTKNPQQNQLCDLLNQFGRNGVPQIKSSFSIGHPLYEEAMDYLENLHSSWTVFVDQTGMTEVEMKIQSAIWELVTTEVYYIHALQTVTDLFLACLKAVQAEKLLTEVDQNKLFSNIREICETNLKFWTCHLFPMVHHSITTGHPMCIDYFRPGFIVFAQLFSSYTKYCAEQSTCQYYCRELNRSNGLFTAYLAWCESHKKCNRLRLADILVRPMQRLTKYSLLLVAIRKHVQDENNAEMIDAMIHSVEGFVCSVNSHLTTRQENERLKGIMARIESYDVVDSNNETLDKMVKSYSGMFDLCAPIKGCAITSGRHLFMEGDLRFKDSQNKVDVHCFLLTDILLICKTIAKKGHGTLKVIRQPFMTDKLKIKLKENTLYCVYLNELDIVVTAFTLQCHSQSVTQSWHDGITKARHIYTRLKQGAHQDNYLPSFGGPISDTLGVKSSPRSVGSSHSGSVELNESRNISIDFEKTNSLSSDEGSSHGFGGIGSKVKYSQSTLIQSNNQSISNLNNCGATANYSVNHSNYPNNHHFVSSNSNNSSSNHQANSGANCGNGKTKAVSATTLDVKHGSVLRQSLPNLNLNSIPNSHSNTLSVPGASSNPSTHGNLLSPSHRGISYPPPSPTRATLRRGFAISTSTKNPPLVKTRNVTSQNSILWPSSTPGSFAAPPPTVHPPVPSGSPQISSPSHEPPPADSGTRPGPCESEV